MIYLGELLAYLDRGQADEVVLQSGQPPRLRVGQDERSLSDEALHRDAILAALHGVSLGNVIPAQDTAGEVQIVDIRGSKYLVNVARFLDLMEVRFAAIPSPTVAARDVKAALSKHPTQRSTSAPEPDVASTSHPTKREGSKVGPLAERALESADDGGHATKREASGVGPLAGAALELAANLPDPAGEDVTVGSLAAAALELTAPSRASEAALPSLVPNHAQARARLPHPAAAPLEPIHDDHTVPVTPVPSGPRRAPGPRAIASPDRPDAAAAPGKKGKARALEPLMPDAVADILAAARAESASDVHLCSEEPVRVRVAGALHKRGILVDHALLERTAAEILKPQQAAQLAARGHVDLSVQDSRAGRLRVNLCRRRGGLKLCARLVAASPPSREDLGLPPEIQRIELLHQGLVVIAGPSGHGKTTTMAALVDALASRRPIHVITVEDPVEILHPVKRALVTQREVGTHTKSFAAALSAALREDPDVIAIGELRDRETVEMALTAAETGHLVLATMNTPSGAKTIERLIELFPPDDQPQVRASLCGALKLVVSQRLLPRSDRVGLVAAYEVITGGPPLWGLIRDRKLHQLPSLLQRGKAFGMRRIEDSLRDLVLQHAISEDTALRNASDPRALMGADPTAGTSWNPMRTR